MAAGEDSQDFAEAKDRSDSGMRSAEQDRTKRPVANAFLSQVRPVTCMIANFVHTYERFGNALAPTSPFPKHKPKLLLATCLLPLLFGSWVATPVIIVKGTGFVFGFAIFGRPIMLKAAKLMSFIYPRWTEFTELHTTLLREVPTNAQLTLSLLRIGERNGCPLPPPPGSQGPPSLQPDPAASSGVENLPASQKAIDDAVQPDGDLNIPSGEEEKSKHGGGMLGLLKGTAKSGLHIALGADRLRAHAGSRDAKERAGSLKPVSATHAGPTSFPARHRGKKGELRITTCGARPSLTWTTISHGPGPVWSTAIADIHEIGKTGSLVGSPRSWWIGRRTWRWLVALES